MHANRRHTAASMLPNRTALRTIALARCEDAERRNSGYRERTKNRLGERGGCEDVCAAEGEGVWMQKS